MNPTPNNPAGVHPLTITNLSISFVSSDGSTITIAEDFNLTIPAGALHCIIGRSGSGKTSILRTAAGLTRPQQGVISWWGTDIATLTDDQMKHIRRHRIGYADQASALIPDLTSLENVLIPILPDGKKQVLARRDEAEDLLDAVGLSTRAHHLPNQLSGGERQRVALARALVQQPDILIADEPTASLDRTTADKIIQVIADYAADHTVIVASHDPHLAHTATSTTTLEPETP